MESTTPIARCGDGGHFGSRDGIHFYWTELEIAMEMIVEYKTYAGR